MKILTHEEFIGIKPGLQRLEDGIFSQWSSQVYQIIDVTGRRSGR